MTLFILFLRLFPFLGRITITGDGVEKKENFLKSIDVLSINIQTAKRVAQIWLIKFYLATGENQ